jgi:hypothetical protein
MKQQHESRTLTKPSPETAELFVSAVLGSSITGDVTNIQQLNIYQAPAALAPLHPDLRIGFASTFVMALQPTTTLAPFAGNSSGFYIRRDDSVSIRTDNLGPVTARQLAWSYVFPAGVPVWSGPGFDGLTANIGGKWIYQPTYVGVAADGLNPGSAMIHHFNIGLPRDGRLQVPISVTVGMVDEPPVSVMLVAHIPDVVAEALRESR